ncbi:multiple sugar transport system substrate-binding protein [Nakamurella sp. UYEF19]|uniref:extracellular solute-binding protein n=1 Tax=Nakamurella sp. UYEF19 TaxID=1756392 RepID=UPI0033910689
MAVPLSRRRFLGAAGVLALAGATASACANPVTSGLTGKSPNPDGLTYWNLFSGGDGANMVLMENAYQQANPTIPLESTTLAWGNPYYTKLALASAGGQPPDVAVTHLTRLALLARAGLVTDLSTLGTAEAGMTASSFTPAAWQKSQVDGKPFAIPLDTHPFVLYYNIDVAKKAGLLDADNKLKAISGKDEFISALQAMKKATGAYGGVININNDPSTNWRWFNTLYGQLEGQVVTDQGRKVVLDDEKAAKVLDFMHQLTGPLGLFPSSIDGQGVTSLFSTGKCGFLLDGEWQIPTYEGSKTNFSVVPIPALLSEKSVSHADSHALVIPVDHNRSPERAARAVAFVKAMLDNSLVWAKGGHIPAWLPVQKSSEFQAMSPQSNYIESAYSALYDPDAWYSGSGSDFETLMGSSVATVQTGSGSTAAAIASMRAGLTTYANTIPPVKEVSAS